MLESYFDCPHCWENQLKMIDPSILNQTHNLKLSHYLIHNNCNYVFLIPFLTFQFYAVCSSIFNYLTLPEKTLAFELYGFPEERRKEIT